MKDEIELITPEEAAAFYIFADIRGFSEWANRNLFEVRNLLSITYSSAVSIFGDTGTTPNYLRRVVKFLGDGFFAVREYNETNIKSFKRNLFLTLFDMTYFKNIFIERLNSAVLHHKEKIGISLGLSYGKSIKFHLSNFPKDYAGDRINLASRLCSVAESSEIAIEHDLKKYILEFVKDKSIRPVNIEEKEIDLKGFGKEKFIIIKGVEGFVDKEVKILCVLRDGNYIYRSVSGLSKHSKIANKNQTQKILFKLEAKKLVGERDRGKRSRYFLTDKGRALLKEKGL